MASGGSGVGGMAARYASALYDLSDESNTIDEVAADLEALLVLIDDSEDFARFIRSPVLSSDERSRGIEAIALKVGLSTVSNKFLRLVASNGRLFALPEMILAFQAILASKRGLVTADVIAATELTESQTRVLTDSLRAAIGNSVTVNTKVDPSIIGGLIVRVGSRMVDSSLKSKLQRLKLSMKGVG